MIVKADGEITSESELSEEEVEEEEYEEEALQGDMLGQAQGLTWFIPGEDPFLISKKQLFARIVGGLRGRAVKEVIFGETEITTRAFEDLQQITQIARKVSSINKIWTWIQYSSHFSKHLHIQCIYNY